MMAAARSAALWPASPFNGGYIELWVEEADLTGDAAPLRAAEALATAWVGTETFQRHGLFEARRSVRLPALQRIGRRMSASLIFSGGVRRITLEKKDR